MVVWDAQPTCDEHEPCVSPVRARQYLMTPICRNVPHKPTMMIRPACGICPWANIG